MYSFTIGSLAVSQFRSSTPPYLLSTGSLAMSQLQSGPQWLALQSAHPMVSLPRLACCPPGALPLGCDLFFAIVPLPLPKLQFVLAADPPILVTPPTRGSLFRPSPQWWAARGGSLGCCPGVPGLALLLTGRVHNHPRCVGA